MIDLLEKCQYDIEDSIYGKGFGKATETMLFILRKYPTANVAPIADTVKKMQERFSLLLKKEYEENTPDGASFFFKNGSLMMWSIADRVFAQIAKEMLEGE